MWHTTDFIYQSNRIMILLFFLVFLNVLTFFLYLIDKRKAVKGKWRISERTLIFYTLSCGGIGALFGMWILKHKTKKRKFKASLAVGLMIVSVILIHIVHNLIANQFVRYVGI